MQILILLVLMALLPLPGQAHNGTLGQALPVDGIVLDGDLGDWPDDMTRYPLALPGDSVASEDEADFSGAFRVGFNEAENALYVGVEVKDNSVTVKPPEGVKLWYNTQDGCELYIDLHEIGVNRLPTQLRVWGDERGVEGPGSVEAFQVEISRSEKQIIYEWRVDLESLGEGKTRLHAGRSLGFDVSIEDVDADGSSSWISWSPGAGKWNQNEQIGDMLLVAEQVSSHAVKGRLAWDDGNVEALPQRVRLSAAGVADLWVQASVDSLGRYAVSLPKGVYNVEAVDAAEIRLEMGRQVQVDLDGPVDAPLLRVKRLPKPGLIPAKGILLQAGSPDSAHVGRFVRAYMEYHHIPGLSLALIKDGRIAHVGSYGVKHIDSGEKVDERTLFQGASMTKTVFSYAVGRLVERGVLDLDTPLYTYWPYEDIAYDERYKKITARMVLSHRTGFPNWRPSGKLEIHFEPGTEFSYSGEGFEFLGYTVAYLTGKSLDQVLEEEVFGPLGIEDACVSWREDPEKKTALTAEGHINGDRPRGFKWEPSQPHMASSLHIAAGQYAKFALAVMEGKGLSVDYLAQMLRPHSYVPEDWDNDASGLGIFMTETPVGKAYGHGGSNPAFKCEFSVYPKHEIGYVYMVNSDQGQQFHESLKAFLVNGTEPVLTADAAP